MRVTLLGARTNLCDGDLLLLAPPLAGTPVPGGPNAGLPPGARRLWASYLRHLGESTELGPYPAGTELLLGIVPTSVCASGGSAPRPSDGPSARIAQPAPGVWDVWWEDWLAARRGRLRRPGGARGGAPCPPLIRRLRADAPPPPAGPVRAGRHGRNLSFGGCATCLPVVP